MSEVERSFYRVKELAHKWSVSEWEVRRLVKAGELERRYFGRTYRITAESVAAYEAALPSEPV